jgi:16S rRNA (cytosine1402-N4)-methyltransferase
MMSGSFLMEAHVPQHIPVLLDAVMRLLACRNAGFYVDGTVGGAGYTEAILRASGAQGRVLGLDWDATALERAGQRLREHGSRLLLKQANFADLPEVLSELGLGAADGVVVDLGISSLQLNDPQRGFSFMHDGPLDMRMDKSLANTAADLANLLPERELADLIYELGEERWARRIAHAIVLRRQSQGFSHTLDLAELITTVVPKSRDTLRIHPATRTFQALRLAVNQELESLRRFLDRVLDVLKPGGRLCVVAFHSLEDRQVKQRFRHWASRCRCAPGLPRCQCAGQPLVLLLTKKALKPDSAELERNPRARSARLRAVEKK